MNVKQNRGRVLVLDDEKNIVIVLRTILEKRGFQVEGFTSSLDAVQVIENKEFDAVVTDLFMPELDGLGFLAKVHAIRPKLPVIMITAFGTVDTAVDAIKAGAFDYVTKPFEQSEICAVVEKAIHTDRLRRLELVRNPEESTEKNKTQVVSAKRQISPYFKGGSNAMSTLRQNLESAIANPVNVVIIGETGTGREYLAEDIHRNSSRSRMAFIHLNCAAIPEDKQSLELFGDSKKIGRVEQADNGILFLDEIHCLTLAVQVQLYQFLSTGQIESSDGLRTIESDIRTIASSSLSLESLVRNGKFREDLFYKLSVIQLEIPPLRERREDLGGLIQYIGRRIVERLGRGELTFSESLVDELRSLEWRGNLPQLENVLERIIIHSGTKGTVLSFDRLPDFLTDSSVGLHPGEPAKFREMVKTKMNEFERELIQGALQTYEENITKTARFLGISRKGLQNKMKELGIR